MVSEVNNDAVETVEQHTTETVDQTVNEFDDYRDVLEGADEETLVNAIDEGKVTSKIAKAYLDKVDSGEQVFTEVSSDNQEETESTETEGQESVPPEEFTVEEKEKLLKQNEEKQKLIDKLRTDLGVAKSTTAQTQQQTLPEMSYEEREKYEQNPVAYMYEYNKRISEAKTTHERNVKTIEPAINDLLPIIKELAKAEESLWVPGTVDTFIADPFNPQLSSELMLYVQKAKTKVLQDELSAKEKQIQDIKLNKESEARQIAANVTKQKPRVTAQAAQQKVSDNGSDIDLQAIFDAKGEEAICDLIDNGVVDWADVKAWRAKQNP